MKRRSLTFFLLVVFLMWNVLTYFFIAYRPQGKDDSGDTLSARLVDLQTRLKSQVDAHEQVLKELEDARRSLMNDIIKMQRQNESLKLLQRHQQGSKSLPCTVLTRPPSPPPQPLTRHGQEINAYFCSRRKKKKENIHTKNPQDRKQQAVTKEGPDLDSQLALLQHNIKDQLKSNVLLLKELERYRQALRQEATSITGHGGGGGGGGGFPSTRVTSLPSSTPVPSPSHATLTSKGDQGDLKAADRGEKDADKGEVKEQEEEEEEDPNKVPLPVLLIACNRPTSVIRSLDQLLKYRPSAERFPIIVSQDCGHEPTAAAIAGYGDKVTHIRHPDLSDIPLPRKDTKFKGYYKIARHYKWALQQIFNVLRYKAVIVVEDDLDFSPDFFAYFAATFPILRADSSLWCVSAWNDNGKESMVANEPELLYRTDFFPGLGWMVERDVWKELEDKWPPTFWDDWMRHPDQRRDRSCIRPELSRTKTFGKIGVSRGQFYEKYLKFIKLNEAFVPFTEKDLSYLKKEHYDEQFVKTVYGAPLLSAAQVQRGERPDAPAVRVQYSDKTSFKTQAKQLGIMEDLKSGVPRAGYRGIVAFLYKGRRVFYAPEPNWSGYDPTWS